MENRNLGNLTKYRNLQKMENRNLQIINCDIGRDVINSPPARKEYRNLQIYLEKSQLSQLSQKSQISQFMLSPKCEEELLGKTILPLKWKVYLPTQNFFSFVYGHECSNLLAWNTINGVIRLTQIGLREN